MDEQGESIHRHADHRRAIRTTPSGLISTIFSTDQKVFPNERRKRTTLIPVFSFAANPLVRHLLTRSPSVLDSRKRVLDSFGYIVIGVYMSYPLMRNLSLLMLIFFVGCGAEAKTEIEGANPGECYDGADNDEDGDFDGIGVQLAPDRLLVAGLMDGGAATQAGMLVGDLITSIDGKPIDEMDRLDSISMLRGQPGTQVQVRINRQGEEVDITITRAVLK